MEKVRYFKEGSGAARATSSQSTNSFCFPRDIMCGLEVGVGVGSQASLHFRHDLRIFVIGVR